MNLTTHKQQQERIDHALGITALDIDRAYRLSRLRDEGIGLQRAIETPIFYKALYNTAKAMKLKQKNGNPAT
jgi:hypothetical protein